MKVKELIKLLEQVNGEDEVFIRNSVNPCGTIGELIQVEKGQYGFMGVRIDCILFNTEYAGTAIKTNPKYDETDETEKEPYFMAFVNTRIKERKYK